MCAYNIFKLLSLLTPFYVPSIPINSLLHLSLISVSLSLSDSLYLVQFCDPFCLTRASSHFTHGLYLMLLSSLTNVIQMTACAGNKENLSKCTSHQMHPCTLK